MSDVTRGLFLKTDSQNSSSTSAYYIDIRHIESNIDTLVNVWTGGTELCWTRFSELSDEEIMFH